MKRNIIDLIKKGPLQMPNNPNDHLLDDLIGQAFTDESIETTTDLTSETQSTNIYAQLSVDRKKQADALAKKIDENQSESIVSYGTQAQKQLNHFSQQMLSEVKNQDLGEIGENLRDLMLKLKKNDLKTLNTADDQPVFLRWLKKQKASLFEQNAKYQKISYQIDQIAETLKVQKNNLLNNNQQLEGLYQQNYQYFEALNVFIAAGEVKLNELKNERIPRIYQSLKSQDDQMTLQKVYDLEQFTNRLEKRIYDLQLSRQITIQQAPQIHIIQNTNQTLAEKIQSSINTAIPLWKNQMAIQLSLSQQENALSAQKDVANTTNQLLQKNADMLEQSTLEIARQSEHGVVDIETLQYTQERLIHTLEETLAIQQEGRLKRAEAENQMAKIETKLKQKLANQNKN